MEGRRNMRWAKREKKYRAECSGKRRRDRLYTQLPVRLNKAVFQVEECIRCNYTVAAE